MLGEGFEQLWCCQAVICVGDSSRVVLEDGCHEIRLITSGEGCIL